MRNIEVDRAPSGCSHEEYAPSRETHLYQSMLKKDSYIYVLIQKGKCAGNSPNRDRKVNDESPGGDQSREL